MRLLTALVVAVFLANSALADDPPKRSFKVTFTSKPSGANVEINTNPKCRTKCSLTLEEGAYVVGMNKPGHEWKEELIEIDSKRTISWKLPLVLGKLTVESVPEGLKVEITKAGESRARVLKTPVENLDLAPGSYTVELLDTRFQQMRRMVTVEPEAVSSLVLEPIGRLAELHVTVLDDVGDRIAADIYANGRKLKGGSPWTLKPGKYTIEVKLDGKSLSKQQADLTPDGVIEMTVTTGEAED